MYKFLLVLLTLALSLSVSAGTLTQTQVTGQSYSSGFYQSDSIGVRMTHQSSFGADQQTYSNNCSGGCGTDNTATFSYDETVDSIVFSSASASGMENSSTSFHTTQISTDNLTGGNSNSVTHNSRSGVESNGSLTLVAGHRMEVETSSNGGAEYGEVITLSSWGNVGYAAYSGTTSSSSVVTSQTSFLY